MAFKKEIIKRAGFFDEKFNYGSDMDFTWRTTDLGYKIRYNKDATIYHDWGNLQQEIKCIFRKDPDTVSGNFRTAFRNYPDSITAYPDTLSNH